MAGSLSGQSAIRLVIPRDGALGARVSSWRSVSAISPPFEIVWPGGEGGNGLLKAAPLLLVAWLLGVAGADNAGMLVHVLLLVGLMLLLLAVLKARDVAARPRTGSPSDHR